MIGGAAEADALGAANRSASPNFAHILSGCVVTKTGVSVSEVGHSAERVGVSVSPGALSHHFHISVSVKFIR